MNLKMEKDVTRAHLPSLKGRNTWWNVEHFHGIIVEDRKESPLPHHTPNDTNTKHTTPHNTTWEQDPECPALRTGAVG